MYANPEGHPVQENHPTERPTDDLEPRPVTRHRRARRRPYLTGALVAAVALGITGVSAATFGAGDDTHATTATADESQARLDAANRADRSARETPTASPSGIASPTPASPSPASPSPASPKTTAPSPKKSAPTVKKAPPKPKAAWVNPMPGAETTSCFGIRWGTLHAGIDLAEPEGTAIHAAAAGTVVNAGWAFSGYGISVVIDHGNGYLTHYAHQSRTIVSVGQKVAAGQIIGYEGATGDATGPHLHFEVHQGQLWNQIDPAPYMRQHGVDLGC